MMASKRDEKYIDAIEKITGQTLNRREMMDIEVREDIRPRGEQGGRGGRDGGRGGKDRNRGRDGKQRDRRPPDGKYHDMTASLEPAQAAPTSAEPQAVQAEAPRPAEQPREPRREQRPREQQQREQRPRGESQEKRPPSERQQQEKRERHSQRHHNEQAAKPEAVDRSQLPAFLLRPVPVTRKPEPQE